MIDVERHSCIIRPIELSRCMYQLSHLHYRLCIDKFGLLLQHVKILDIGSQFMAYVVLCLTFSRIDSWHCVFD